MHDSRMLAAKEAVLKTPIPFGKYYLLDRINVGGMAEVFQAKAFGLEGFERIVAVKRILATIAEDKDFISMFIDEAKIAVQLNHANVCQVFDLGKVGDAYYIAMEYVSGRDVRAIFDRCKQRLVDGAPVMPIAQSCFITMKVCEGLDYAHNKKDSLGNDLHLVHRDVSPQNIIISFEGEVKLIDFGIAKAAGKGHLTQAGILKGKFGYMSPEQVRGMPLDRRSDIFSVGIVLYELLTGERLFTGESDFATLEKVRNVEIVPPTMYNRKIPEELERIVLKALQREPEDRYQNAIDLHDDLQAFMYTSGEFYARKDLSGWMKRVFRAEMDAERAALDAVRDFKPDGVAATSGAPRRSSTMGLRTIASAGSSASAGSGQGEAPSSWTPERPARERDADPLPPPPGSLQAPGNMPSAPPPGRAAAPSRPPAPARREEPPQQARRPAPEPVDDAEDEGSEMTTVDGAARAKVADFVWDEEELDTHIYQSAMAASEAGAEVVEERAVVDERVERDHHDENPTLSEEDIEAVRTDALRAAEEAARRAEAEAATAALARRSVPTEGTPPKRAELPPPPAGATELKHSFSPGVASEAIRTGVQQKTAGRPFPKGAVLALSGVVALALVGTGAYLALSNRSGEIILTAEPPTALSIFVNQDQMKISEAPDRNPARLRLRPGTYQVTVKREGYLPWTDVVRVSASDPAVRHVKLELVAARTGGLTIYSDPPGARAFLDGQELGQVTPMRVQSVMPGAHKLELRLGDRVWQQQVTLDEGKMLDIRATLPPAAAAPTPAPTPAKPPEVAQKPPEAPPAPTPTPAKPPEVAQKPPAVAQAEPARDKEPAKDKDRDKDKDKDKDKDRERREPRQREPVAQGSNGYLRINSKPWTKIMMDGQETGLNTPQPSMKVPAGSHKITLYNVQFNVRETFSVTVKPGETVTLVKDLLSNKD